MDAKKWQCEARGRRNRMPHVRLSIGLDRVTNNQETSKGGREGLFYVSDESEHFSVTSQKGLSGL